MPHAVGLGVFFPPFSFLLFLPQVVAYSLGVRDPHFIPVSNRSCPCTTWGQNCRISNISPINSILKIILLFEPLNEDGIEIKGYIYLLLQTNHNPQPSETAR